jgi:hypothetical protein
MRTFLLPLAAAICIPVFAAAQSPESQDPALTESIQIQTRCLVEQAKALDDHRSDAGTIADGVMGACNPQIIAAQRAAMRTAPMSDNVAQDNAALEKAVRNATVALILQLRARAEKP